VVIVDSDPDTLVAVRRKDVDLDTKEGREMAMLDNLTTQVNLAWDETELESISDQVEGFDPALWGIELPDTDNIDDFFKDIEENHDGSKGFKITVGVPPEYNDRQNEIVAVITEALQKYDGIKIK
jgi:hypothetical protein